MTEVEQFETPDGHEYQCKKCGSMVEWKECNGCDDGFSHHECLDDTCCCKDPEPNMPCNLYGGKGGWWSCINCDDAEDDE